MGIGGVRAYGARAATEGVAGVIFGSQYFLYYHLLSKEDVSNIIGLIYAYPVIVALLSFFFLDERLSLLAYAGMGLILLGGLMLSSGAKNLKKGFGIWPMFLIIILVALHEFFIKLATTHLPELNGIAITLISIGLTLATGLLHAQTRQGFREEFKNLKWAVATESLTIVGLATTYFAMAGLPATIVATIASTQPLVVLFSEKILHRCGIKICSDERLLPKLVPISVIVAGIAIMYQVV